MPRFGSTKRFTIFPGGGDYQAERKLADTQLLPQPLRYIVEPAARISLDEPRAAVLLPVGDENR